MNNLKDSFTIMKTRTTLKMTTLCHAIRMYGMFFNKSLINLDRLVITGKYHTSVFCQCTDLALRARSVLLILHTHFANFNLDFLLLFKYR